MIFLSISNRGLHLGQGRYGRLQILCLDEMMAHLINFNLLIGSSVLVFIFLILLTSSISFTLGYSISWIEIFLATCISLAFGWWGVSRYFKEHKLKTFGILCSTVVILF